MNKMYDIFRDFPDSGPIWIEAVQGLENANRRLLNIIELNLGSYFVYDSDASKVVARTIGPGKVPDAASLDGTT